ncbi:MAG: L,D-transpeptidase [Lachnospiraceae bacterium]|nr:L,D-transpeptidase [Lachnospiraceae bacterium]
MKRAIVICLLAVFMLTGCMTSRKDYSSILDETTPVLVPFDSVKEAVNADRADTEQVVPVQLTEDSAEAARPGVYEEEKDEVLILQGLEQSGKEDTQKLTPALANAAKIIDNTSDEAADSVKTNGMDTSAGVEAKNITQAKTVDSGKGAKEKVTTDTVSEKSYGKKDAETKNGTDTDKENEKKTGKDKEKDSVKESEKEGIGKKDKKDKDSSKVTKEKSFKELAPSVSMSFEELVGDNGIYGYPEAFPEAGTYRIVVDLYHQVVMAYTKDEESKYTVPVRYMLCSSGANSSQSPTGTFKMKSYRVRYALFNNTTSYAQYWSLITGRIYFHSILYTAKDPATYTESYKKLGTNVSHGCIRLTVPDARWIWYNCAPETEVEIRKGSKKDEETAAIREKLVLAGYPSERLRLKSGKAPWTDNWQIDDVPQEVEFVQGSQD